MTGTLFSLFDRTAKVFPDNIALDFGTRHITYGELAAQVAAIGSALPEVPGRIGLMAVLEPFTYAAYLAIIGRGHAVVPLSPALPPARLASIVDSTGIQLISRDITGSGRPWTDRSHPDGVAYILFTSGSTGRPKGVPITHRNAMAYVTHAVAQAGVDAASRLSHAFELTFDPSVFDMFAAWSTGATLCVPGPRELLMPARYVNARGITHWFSVPSVVSLARRIGAIPAGGMPHLRFSQFIGEQLTYPQAAAWCAAAPQSTVDNVYGPTELTVACTEYRLPPDPADWPDTSNRTVPIGHVYPRLDWTLSSDSELQVRGVQRFAGYLDERDNDAAFAPSPGDGRPVTPQHWYLTGDRVRIEHGVLVHLGRLDRQIKLNGYRIELGEIEALLRTHTNVDDAVVVVVRNTAGFDVLRAIVTGAQEAVAELPGHMAARLPEYMHPASYLWLPDMPLNPNGKIDVVRLAREAQ